MRTNGVIEFLQMYLSRYFSAKFFPCSRTVTPIALMISLTHNNKKKENCTLSVSRSDYVRVPLVSIFAEDRVQYSFFLLLCVRLIIRAMGVTVLLHGRNLAEKYLLKYICKNSITPFVRTYFSFK